MCEQIVPHGTEYPACSVQAVRQASLIQAVCPIQIQFVRQMTKFKTLAKLTQARYGRSRMPATEDLCQKTIIVAAIAVQSRSTSTNDHFFSNSASITFSTSGSSGFVRGPKRATISPLRPTTNFSKFQLIFPGPTGFVSSAVKFL